MFLKKVKWIKAFYYFYLLLLWSLMFTVLFFLGWQGYSFLTSDLFIVQSPYNIEFRLIKTPQLPYLDFDEHLLHWRNENFSQYAPFFIYQTRMLQKKIRKQPFINNIYIDKRYPNSIIIRYTVREPLMGVRLINEGKTETYIIDREGHVILKSKDSLVKHIPGYITQSPYNYSQSGWRGHHEIRYCLELLERILEDSRLQNIYWQLEGIRYSNPDEILFKFRNKGEFIVHAQNLDELLSYLRKEAHNLSDLNGKTILIRGERE